MCTHSGGVYKEQRAWIETQVTQPEDRCVKQRLSYKDLDPSTSLNNPSCIQWEVVSDCGQPETRKPIDRSGFALALVSGEMKERLSFMTW